MNDIRRTILWVIFGFSMVLLWDKWQLHNGNKATFFPSTPTVTAPAAQGAASSATGAASVPASSAPVASWRPRLLRPRANAWRSRPTCTG